MREEAGERRVWRRTVQASAVGRRFLREAQRDCGHRHRDYREEQAGGADGGKSRQRRRKSHNVEEEEEAEKIRNWARIVRPDGWTGEIQRTLVAMAIRHSKIEAGSALLWQRRMEEQRQGLLCDEMVWVAPRRKRRHPEGAHWSMTTAAASREWLPFHLILGRLPVRQLCQLPCVCKPWHLMLEAGEVQIDTNAKREEYWFLMSKPPPPGQENWNFMAFSSHSDVQGKKDWAFFRPPLPSQSHTKLLSLLGGLHCSLLSKFERRHFKFMGCCTPRLVSTGGLMCTFVRKRGAADFYRIIVFNCLTGSVKVLPPPVDPRHLFGQMSARHKFCYMHMAIDDVDPARYYIMLTHKQTFQVPAYFEIFDSRIGSWKVGCNPEVATANYEVADGDFFHLQECVYSSAGTPNLFAYHAADDVWSKVAVPKRGMDEFGCVFTLLKCNGRLFQAVQLKVSSHYERICLGFVVTELQMTSSQYAVWVEVARTPQHLWHWLPYAEWDAVIKAEGSLFYMTIGDAHLRGRFKPPLVYDIAQNNWYVLPSERGTTDFGCILVHRPRLSMRMPSLADSEESDEALVPLPTVGEGNETRASFTQDFSV